MTKRFELVWKDTGEVLHDNETGLDKGIYSSDYRFHVRDMMNEISEENEELKQYKQTVSDVLLSYSQKNLSTKQLGLLTAIMHELGVLE